MFRSIMGKLFRRINKYNSLFVNKRSIYHSSRTLSLEHLEARELLDGTYYWDGSHSDVWSDYRNWVGNVAPSGTDNKIYFSDEDSPNKETWNNLSSQVTFSTIGFGTTGYTIEPSNPIYLTSNAIIVGVGASGTEIKTSMHLDSGQTDVSLQPGSDLT